MFLDNGVLAIEHARDLRREASAERTARAVGRTHRLRSFASRMQLGPTHNYRAR